MRRFPRMASGLTLVAVYLIASAVQAQNKPNILVIWGDDIGWNNFSGYHQGMMGGRTEAAPPTSTVWPGKAPGLRTTTPSRAAPPDAHRSSLVSTRFEPAYLRSACRGPNKVCSTRIPPLRNF